MPRPAIRRTFGVDEAGRGPILGPMAIAVVAVDPVGARRLTRRGVTDSKRFGSGARARAIRAELAASVREIALACAVELVDVATIDSYVFRGRLNVLEREIATALLAALGADRDPSRGDRIICDGARLFGSLSGEYENLRARDHAESFHAAVAAASIVAKDARDRAFATIAERYAPEFGPIEGGGYLNPRTRAFLDAYVTRHGRLPPEARRSWGAEKQPSLFDRA